MTAALLLGVIASLVWAVRGDGLRDRFLRALVAFGVVLVISTELLGSLRLLSRLPLTAMWSAVLAAALARGATRKGSRDFALPFFRLDAVIVISSLGVVTILGVTAVVAAFSPPNSADAMAYHMPRVVYWAEQASVRFFPTPYLNQLMLQPLAEYLMLHTYVLSGGDHFVNFVQWFASLASMIGVSGVAKLLGAEPRGQAVAALFCATLPAGILASSGAKNDYWLAMWLVTAVYFALQFAESRRLQDAAWLGGALGLALLTKGTAYLFAPWPVAAVLMLRMRARPKRLVAGLLIAAGVALGLNAMQYARNYRLSGSVLGFDSAQGDGVFRWRNETFGWRETASNAARHLSEQLGDRSERWNEGVYSAVIAMHKGLGLDVNDPRTTFRGSTFSPTRNANHEADGAK